MARSAWILLRPRWQAKYCDKHVCLSAGISPELPVFVCGTYGRRSVLQTLLALRHVTRDSGLWMTSLKMTQHMGQRGSDRAAYTQTDPPGAAPDGRGV